MLLIAHLLFGIAAVEYAMVGGHAVVDVYKHGMKTLPKQMLFTFIDSFVFGFGFAVLLVMSEKV